jgi:integrase
MARRPRASRLESRTSRLKLPVRERPTDFTALARGLALGYRRNKTNGAWIARVANGKGGWWTRKVGLADDYEDADGERVLNFWQAQDKARLIARGDADEAAAKPLTFSQAIDEYAADLAARGAGAENATRIRKNLTASLAEKAVGSLSARDLSTWRDGLLASGVKPATMVRLSRAVKAALNLAARRDHRIANSRAWTDGLGGLSEDYETRNIQRLDDDQVRAVVAASYALDPAFGLYAEVGAETGARPSQLSRLVVGDLQDGANPRLMMPSSRKGRGRKASRYPVPVTKQLADKLMASAHDRAPGEPLLIRPDGRRWQDTDLGDYANLFEKVVAELELDVTFYALRHSAIIRSLLAGVPIRIIAASVDSSSEMIERTYSSHVAHFADEIARRGLLVPASSPPPQKFGNVEPFVRRPRS